ncbi:asparagine synthase (glutamine-hydrolyzing) [Salinarimonas ramus]|uniref:asparagine synthase (glutamine-hydrolyzing) n=1 Tax=Salinarimonas ramus TaxID=690164 RepID=UPI001FCE6A3F|nr:asparagine synthase (glutamine-hydrolyzing) [Salinarimonas ramus]
MPRGTLEPDVRAMTARLVHRGPDSDGVFVDLDAGIALGHRRLAILDRSEAGSQPIVSSDGRWVMVYNGEIYGLERLRNVPALADVRWRGSSDTEVLLESIAHRGLDETLRDADGMFAFAVFDRREQVLHLARDRFGMKPLVYQRGEGGVTWIASDTRCLGRGIGASLDPHGIATFLRYGHVPSPHTIFRDIVRLGPGEIASISRSGTVVRRWWSLDEWALAPRAASKPEAAIDVFEEAFDRAVRERLIADVPLGAFLSGGVDSALVVSSMVRAASEPVRTFSIGFPDLGYDETPIAAEVAKRLGTRHTSARFGEPEAAAAIPDLIAAFDEPFADASALPTLMLSRLARREVVVALSGDGGDELFAGYDRHRLAGRLGALRTVPLSVRVAFAKRLSGMQAPLLDGIAARAGISRLSERLRKLGRVMASDAEPWLEAVSLTTAPQVLVDAREHDVPLPDAALSDPLDRMRWLDMSVYLGDGVLQKVDRASMAASLEVRPAFLSNDLARFAWSLPRDRLLGRGRGKLVARALLARRLPGHLATLPKRGFSVPLAAWLRGSLRSFAGDLLVSAEIGGGHVNARAVRALWDEHASGRRDNAYALWPIVVLEAWCRRPDNTSGARR